MPAKLVVILLLILGVSANLGVLAKTRPPKVYLNEDYVIHSNDNLTIKCEASEPISWTYPNNTIYGESFSHFSIRYEFPNNKENKFVALLNINNASFIDTGFYYCHEIGYDFNSNRSSEIYLFVKDDEDLTVMLDDIETVYSVYQDSVILPCRPTSPDTNVKLYRSSDDSEVRLGETLEDGSIAKFDPRYGFIFVNHEIYGDQTIVYLCSFFRDHVTQNITMLLIMDHMTTSIAVPHIEDLNLGHSVEGDTLRLKCTLICSVQFVMSWRVPNPDGFETGRIIENKVNSTNVNTHFEILTIKNVTRADQGPYTCLVEDNNNNKNNNTLKVKIFGKTTPIAVPHIEDLNLGHSVEGDTLRLKCTLICSVQFSLSWTVPNPEGFETGRITESGVNSTDINTHFKILTIKNVTKADQGTYTCLVEDYSTKNNNTLKVKIYDGTPTFGIGNEAGDAKTQAKPQTPAATAQPTNMFSAEPVTPFSLDYKLLEKPLEPSPTPQNKLSPPMILAESLLNKLPMKVRIKAEREFINKLYDLIEEHDVL